MQQTHDITEDKTGNVNKVSECRCGRCDNVWWVSAANEFQPSYCCYCGLKFLWYEDTNEVKRNLSGQKL